MIFPDRVLGRSEYTIKSGVAIGPIASLTAFFRELRRKTEKRSDD